MAQPAYQLKDVIVTLIETSHLIKNHATADQTTDGYDIADYIIEGF